jgi:hypothetical protein
MRKTAANEWCAGAALGSAQNNAAPAAAIRNEVCMPIPLLFIGRGWSPWVPQRAAIVPDSPVYRRKRMK